MRPQHVSVDMWRMLMTAASYLALAFTAWIFLRLVNACFWLPSFLHDKNTKDKQQSDESERRCGERVWIEKVEGGYVVAGVLVSSTCQMVLPAFGCLFLIVGAVLTAVSYRGQEDKESVLQYADRVAYTRNLRVLGPACLATSILMLLTGLGLYLLIRRARNKQRRVSFRCPIHGNSYPLRLISRPAEGVWACCAEPRNTGLQMAPHCPSDNSHSYRPTAQTSHCPKPQPLLDKSASISSELIHSSNGTLTSDLAFGSISSLCTSHDVASFPHSSSTPPSRQRGFSFPQDAGDLSNRLQLPPKQAKHRIRMVAPVNHPVDNTVIMEAPEGRRKSDSCIVPSYNKTEHQR